MSAAAPMNLEDIANMFAPLARIENGKVILLPESPEDAVAMRQALPNYGLEGDNRVVLQQPENSHFSVEVGYGISPKAKLQGMLVAIFGPHAAKDGWYPTTEADMKIFVGLGAELFRDDEDS